MSSIATRHSYRFGYLRSEHWNNLRVRKLATRNAKCEICDHRSLSNDIHHLRYRPNLKDVRVGDLVVLCRECHNAVHAAIVNDERTDDSNVVQSRWKKLKTRLRQQRAAQKIAAQFGKPLEPINYSNLLKSFCEGAGVSFDALSPHVPVKNLCNWLKDKDDAFRRICLQEIAAALLVGGNALRPKDFWLLAKRKYQRKTVATNPQPEARER